MIVDQKTPVLGLPLPHSENELVDDVERLRLALAMLDTDSGTQDKSIKAAQKTADNAVTACGVAQRAANAAQQTANQGVADAGTAQTTADQGVTDAATAQATADDALSKATEALETPITRALGAPAVTVASKISAVNPGKVQMAANAIRLVACETASFEVTIGTNAPVIVPAVDGVAVHQFTPPGVVGDMLPISVVAIDELGNRSLPTTASTELVSMSVDAPQIISPADNEQSVPGRPTFTLSEIATIGGVADTGEFTRIRVATDSAFANVVADTGPGYAYTTTVQFTEDLSPDTDYYVEAFHTGTVYGEGTKTVSRFRTVTASVIGIALVTQGGGSGTWQRVNGAGEAVNWAKTNFDQHPVYKQITSYTIDGQEMVKIPRFYIKTYAPETGAYAGKPIWLISDLPLPGFKVHPAFAKPDGTTRDCYYVGAWQGSDQSGKLASTQASSPTPLVSIDMPTMIARAEARNVGGIEGFQLWDIYQLSAIQRLCLIEMGTGNSQTAIGKGHVDNSPSGVQVVNQSNVVQATWRNIRGLWGNIWQMVDGISSEGSGGTLQIWKNDGSKAWVNTGFVMPDASNHILSLKRGDGVGFSWDDIFFADTLAVEASATIPDNQYYYKNYVYYHGGYCGYGSSAGLFCASISYSRGNTYSNLGGRLAKI